jgi:hypothetical protein
MVTGTIYYISCGEARRSSFKCGTSGKDFEPKEHWDPFKWFRKLIGTKDGLCS